MCLGRSVYGLCAARAVYCFVVVHVARPWCARVLGHWLCVTRPWLVGHVNGQVFVLVYASVRAGALDGLAGQGRDAIVGGWFCVANRGDDNLVKNISVVMARVFVGVWGSCGANHKK